MDASYYELEETNGHDFLKLLVELKEKEALLESFHDYVLSFIEESNTTFGFICALLAAHGLLFPDLE
jgi:hypothetical protein